MLEIKEKKIAAPIIQGGMGVGVSLAPLAGAVAKEGGAGIISSACLDIIASKRTKRKVGIYEAICIEISNAKNMSGGGIIGINIMFALAKDFENSVRAAIDAGADMIISGAGLPLNLPKIQNPKNTGLIPIVSSARALDLICKKWERAGYQPDAVVLEGPLAGGHLGFKMEAIDLEENILENLLGPVKDIAKKYGDFPVIVAGGVFDSGDINKFLEMGADGVQMGTRFLATEESSATPEYKQAVLSAKQEDILVADGILYPGSPCGLPFRVIRQSPMFISSLKQSRAPKCSRGYVLQRDEAGNFTRCSAKENNKNFFCVCNGLISSAGYEPNEEPLYTVGANAYRINKILKVKDLMNELKSGLKQQTR
ncbi:nitronate monooxygenase [Candidatus Azambacteria bacterium]|nr:nitronate monooxygenase [Candidatus Azambacteria bacterium]